MRRPQTADGGPPRIAENRRSAVRGLGLIPTAVGRRHAGWCRPDGTDRVDGTSGVAHLIVLTCYRPIERASHTSYRNSLYNIQYSRSCRDDPRVVLTPA